MFDPKYLVDLFDISVKIPVVRPLIFYSDKEIDKEFQQYKFSAKG